MKGLALLQDGGVEFNVLAVVHRHNARHPRAVYRFLKENGVRFMQFIPLVERRTEGSTLAGPPQQDELGCPEKHQHQRRTCPGSSLNLGAG